MEKTNQLLCDIDKHMRAEWYAGRLPAESWPKSLSDRLAAAVADPAVLGEVVVSKNEAGHIVAVTRQDAEGRVLSTLAISAPIYAAPAAVAVPDERAAFEAAIVDEQARILVGANKSYLASVWLVRDGDTYRQPTVRTAWVIWKLARAALAAHPAEKSNSVEFDGIKTARPVVLPEPDFLQRHEDVCGDEVGPPTAFYTADTLRALLATGGQGQAVANPAIDFPHEEFDAIAATRYKVVAADQSMFWEWAVVAGDGTQQLYVGRKVDCENMARKFAGAFADGSFHAMHAAPQQADARDAAFEAVRKKFCKLQRYSFFLDDKGNVRRVPQFTGNWVEFESVHTLFDPASVDAAIAAAKGE